MWTVLEALSFSFLFCSLQYYKSELKKFVSIFHHKWRSSSYKKSNISSKRRVLQLQVCTKLLLLLFRVCELLSLVSASRDDFWSFKVFVAKSKSEVVLSISSFDFCWPFDDCSEPFDSVVLRRLESSGSDKRR